MLHIYPMCGIFYLPVYTGTSDCQFNISSERHLSGILLMKVCGILWVLHLRIEPRYTYIVDSFIQTQPYSLITQPSHTSLFNRSLLQTHFVMFPTWHVKNARNQKEACLIFCGRDQMHHERLAELLQMKAI